MKRSIILFLLAFVASGWAFGQFALGIKAGYNASKLSAEIDSVKSDINSGFHVGVFSRFGKRLYLAPELQYTMSGAVFSSEGNLSTSNWEQKVKIGSIDVPVLLGFKLIHSDLITWRLEVGPQASFVVNKTVEDENSVLGPIKEADINSVNWHALVGTGIDVLFLKLDLRYQYGLNQLIEDAGNYQLNTQGQMFVVSLGWKIFGKK